MFQGNNKKNSSVNKKNYINIWNIQFCVYICSAIKTDNKICKWYLKDLQTQLSFFKGNKYR